MSKYLDLAGLTYFANKIKAAINAVSETASSALTAAGTAQSAADSAVTDITLGDSTTPLSKTGRVVNIPAATSKQSGVMTAQQAAKMNFLYATVSTSFGTIEYFRFGDVVMCILPSIPTQTIGAWESVSLGTIPEGYRPAGSKNLYYNIVRQSQTTTIPVFLRPSSTGEFVLQNQSGTSVATGAIMATSLMWICPD